MTVDCKVIVVEAGTVAVSRPSFPLTDLNIVPSRFGIKQLTRAQGSTVPDSFVVMCADSGSVVQDGKYDYILSLYLDKSFTTEIYRVKGVAVGNGVVAFSPTKEQASRVGNFFYSVRAMNGNGDEMVLISDSYTYKKIA